MAVDLPGSRHARYRKAVRNFYDRLGDDVAAELVDWFNQVDATYRGDLRELNELNFARFDAKLGERFAELQSAIDKRFAQLESDIDRRFAELRREIDQRFTKLESDIDKRFADFRIEFEQRLGQTETRLIRWMVGLWITMISLWMAQTGAMVFAYLRLR